MPTKKKVALFENPLARQCQRDLRTRYDKIKRTRSAKLEAERELLKRMLAFPFEKYPDSTAPWHLLTWPRMRWWHVYHVVRIIECLRQPTGSNVGEPLVLQPFQILILLAFLGPEAEDGKRLIVEGLLTLSRKQAKSTLIAALTTALMALHPDEHGLKGQEIQVGASDREQAGIIYMMAERMVMMDNQLDLRHKFKSTPSRKTLLHTTTQTQMRCLSSDAYRHHGGNPAIVVLDEIGNVQATQAEEFYSVLTTGFGAQAEPLTLMLSTQAPNDEHFFSQQVDRARAVNESRVSDNTFAGFAFSVPEVDLAGEEVSPFARQYWYLGSPGLGTIASEKDMEDWAKRAQEIPSLLNKFENLRLNRRVSETASFVSRSVWIGCGGQVPPIEELYGGVCYLGIDLSQTTDLTALVCLFESIDGGPMYTYPYFWIPGEGLRGRVERDKVPYDVWEKKGLIDTESSHTVDFKRVAQKVVWFLESFDVQGVGYDRWRMKYLRAELLELGYEFTKEDHFLIEIGQGFRDQSRSIEVLEGLLLHESIAHANHPILKWNAGNAVVIRDPTNARKFEKARSYGRIDGLVALALAAHVRDTLGIVDGGASIYADESVAVIM